MRKSYKHSHPMILSMGDAPGLYYSIVQIIFLQKKSVKSVC